MFGPIWGFTFKVSFGKIPQLKKQKPLAIKGIYIFIFRLIFLNIILFLDLTADCDQRVCLGSLRGEVKLLSLRLVRPGRLKP
jgi:hypothetical protein